MILQKWYKLQCRYVTAFSGNTPFGAALHTSASVLDEPWINRDHIILASKCNETLTKPTDEECNLNCGSAHLDAGLSQFKHLEVRRFCVETLVELILTSVRGNDNRLS